ncbi:hypothetical protein GW17_00046764 [Ensete ventricosum]|nr:hypothetical protein GW17_00046764 [Ensete ventricosum]
MIAWDRRIATHQRPDTVADAGLQEHGAPSIGTTRKPYEELQIRTQSHGFVGVGVLLGRSPKLRICEVLTLGIRVVFLAIERSPSPTKFQQGESSERSQEKEGQASDVMQPRMRVDFPRWEEGGLTGWLSHVERYFRYHRTPEASMVDIVVIHLEGDAIQWYNWLEYTQGVPTWIQFKSGLLNRFGLTEYENIDGQLAKI